ncbi:MAG: hypothetical protein AAF616_08255 [Bacteroidota bacterium]
MKKITNILTSALLVVIFTSCVDDSEGIADEIRGVPNVIGFENNSAAVSAVAGGAETSFEKSIVVAIKGATKGSVSGDVTATISIDTENSTAIEGTHFELPVTSFTIGEGDNSFSEFKFNMLTEGIQAPLAENPVLVLNISSVTGDGNVVAGAPITINMLYLCFADLSGTYTVTNDFCNPTYQVEISQNPDGSWYATVLDGAFLNRCTSNVTLENWGNFNEVCGVIQPSTDLRFGSLGIGIVLDGTWDQDNGILTMSHEDTFFNGGPFMWTSTYTRN